MNPFTKILSALKASATSTTSDRAIGVDIGSSSIKIVELHKKGGRAVLETYSTLALGPYAQSEVGSVTNLSSTELGKALKDAVTEGKVGTKSAAVAIPSSASLVFIVELPPSIGEKQLDSVIPTEARKYIPVPISEVTLDYWVIPQPPTEQKGKTEVLVAAIHNETLSKYREIAKEAGLSASIFEIEIFSAIRSTFLHELQPVMLLDFGASKTKLVIVEHGIVRSFHIINRGSAGITTNISQSLSIDFDRAEEMKRRIGLVGQGNDKKVSDVVELATEYIFNEAKTTMSSYERKYSESVHKVILTGAGVALPGFKERAEEVFGVETAYGDPFAKTEVPQFVANVLKETGPEFAVALGLALRKLN